MKKFLSACLVACLATLSAYASSLEFRYCLKEASQGVSVRRANTTYWGAIEITEETARLYAGASIDAINLVVSSNDNKQVQLFLTYDLDQEPFYVQDDSVPQLGRNIWHSLPLTEKYVIEAGRKFYVGFKAVSTSKYSAPVTEDGGTPCNEGDWIGYQTEGDAQRTWEHLSASKMGNVMIAAVLSGGNIPQHDVELQRLNAPSWVKQTTPFKLRATIKNWGADTIKSVRMNYRLNEDNQQQVLLTDLCIDPLETHTFSCPLQSDVMGQNTLQVWFDAVNGSTTEDVYLHQSALADTFMVTQDIAHRKVLVEVFSTSACSGCPAGHTLLHSILDSKDNIIWVTHHAGFQTDKMTTPYDLEYLWFYNDNTWAPAVMFDRTNMADWGAVNYSGQAARGPVSTVHSYLDLDGMYEACSGEPTFVEVAIDQQSFDASTRTLSLDVTCHKYPRLNVAAPRLNVYLVEDNVVGAQTSGGTNYKHRYVFRDALCGTWGESLEFDASGNSLQHYTTVLPEDWNLENMHIVTFVSKYNAGNCNACQVLNAECVPLNIVAGVTSPMADDAPSQVYSLDGRCVAQSLHPAKPLPAGVYVVKSGNSCRKLLVGQH